MTPKDLLIQVRGELNDSSEPYLWSDAEIFGYIDAAQREFTRRTHGILDSSSPMCVIDVQADEPLVNYDPRILRIKQARLKNDPAQPTRSQWLTLINPEDLELGVPHAYKDYGWHYGSSFDFDRKGASKYLLVGSDENQARLFDIPTDGGTLYLTVERMPLNPIKDCNSKFEIASHHIRYLAHFVRHLAYLKQDAETFDRQRSQDGQNLFDAYCDEAKREQERRLHKYRTVQYGGY